MGSVNGGMTNSVVNDVMINLIDLRIRNNFKYYHTSSLMMGFDFMCGFADTVKGGGKAMGDTLSKVAAVFFGPVSYTHLTLPTKA